MLLDSAGARGEAEAIGIEIARLLDRRRRARRDRDRGPPPRLRPGPSLAEVLGDARDPGRARGVGCRSRTPASAPRSSRSAARPADETAVGALLAHLRSDPVVSPGRGRLGRAADPPRRGDHGRARRPRAGRSRPATSPACARRPTRRRACARWRARRASSPRTRTASERRSPARRRRPTTRRRSPRSSCVPGWRRPSCSSELADLGELPGCRAGRARRRDRGARVGLGAALARPRRRARADPEPVPRPRGAGAGAVLRRACRTASSRAPRRPTRCSPRSAAPRSATRDLRRADQADEERYLFHACVSRPTERLYLSWQSCDEDGAALARSPFVDEVLDLLGPDAEPPERLIQRARPRALGARRSTRRPPTAAARARARPRPADATGAPRCSRASASTRTRHAAALALFAGLPDPDALPGPLRSPAVLAELRRARRVQRQLARGLGRPARTGGSSTTSSRRSGSSPTADPLWLGGVVHAALERLYSRAARRDSIPRPDDVGRWRDRFAELLDEVATGGAGAAQPRPPRGARAGPDPGRGLPRARGRGRDGVPPAPATCSSSASAPLDDERRRRARAGARARRRRAARAGSTGSTSPPTGAARSCATTRPARRSAARTSSPTRGTLQIQLYMLVARRVLGLDPIAGLYQPLGRRRAGPAQAARDRRRRRRAPRRRSSCVGTDRKPSRTSSRRRCERAEAIAVEAAARDARRATSGRDPIDGECPQLLHLPADLPARARARRRRRRAPVERRRELSMSARGTAHARRPRAARRGQREASGRRARDPAHPRAGGGDRGARSRRLPRGRRRHRQDHASSSTATARRSSTTGSRSTGSSPSPSPSAPPPSCAPGSAPSSSRRARAARAAGDEALADRAARRSRARPSAPG